MGIKSFRPFLISRQFEKLQNSRTKIYLSNQHTQSFSAYKHTHNPQLLQSLPRRADAQNVCFETLYVGQFTSSAQLIILNYPVILSHRHSTTVSFEAYPFRSMNSQFYLPTLEKRSTTFSPVSADTSIKISTILFPSA